MNKEEKYKELLEKIKQTPDNIIEEAIDSLSEKMNKEEIEKLLKINETIITTEQCKEHRTLRNDERILLMNNMKIKDYIQKLEQKESILDKVTDKLKQLKTDLKEHEKKYEHKKDISTGLIGVRINAILKIIEGENHE